MTLKQRVADLLAASKDALKEMTDINGDYPAEELAVETRLRKAIAAFEEMP